MKNLNELLEAREALDNKTADLLTIVRGSETVEERELTEDESSIWETLKEEKRTLDKKIELAKEMQTEERILARKHAPKHPKKTPEQKLASDMSVVRGIQNLMANKPLEGAEAEAHQEAVSEARSMGLNFAGNFQIPSVVARANTATGATASGGVSPLIKDDISSFVPFLTPKLFLEELGATMMRGLQGNFKIPIGDTQSSATWATETATATETTPILREDTASPNRLAAYSKFSRQALLQPVMAIENMVREQLLGAEARAVQQAAINGVGTGSTPEGILVNSDVNTVTTGGTLTRAHLIEMRKLIDTANADGNSLCFLTNPDVRAYLNNLLLDAGSGQFVWPASETDMLMGYKAATSTLMPNDLTVSNSGMIFGDWSKLWIMNWGGRSISVDPYSSLKEAQVEVVLDSYYDIKVVQPTAFSIATDIAAG